MSVFDTIMLIIMIILLIISVVGVIVEKIRTGRSWIGQGFGRK